ncbi:MAG: putative glycoside hydrolase [Leptospirales bacterium]|nr:putative glycoside hydrolase [Leptospirales bacterium]
MLRRIYIISIIFITLLFFPAFVFASNYTIYIATTDKGVLISDNDGKSWSSFNKGLPETFTPIRLYKVKEDIYLTTFESGLFKFKNNKWENISPDEFKRRSIYRKNDGYRKISAFAVDLENSKNLAAATKHSIYRSTDGGDTWKSINSLDNKKNYITSLAVSGNKILAGTSFNGIFELTGTKFRAVGIGLPEENYSSLLKFTEQLSSILYDGNDLYAGFYFGAGLYKKNKDSNRFIPIYLIKDKSLDSIVYDIQLHDKKIYFSDSLNTYIYDGTDIIPFDTYDSLIKRTADRKDIITATIDDKTNYYPPISIKFSNPEKEIKSEKASDKKGIYLSITALEKSLNKYIDMAKNSEINTFIIDMKDDFGNIYFKAGDKIASEINAQKRIINFKDILTKLKRNNIYAVARVVVFKDPKLWAAYNGKYAIKDKKTGKQWKGTENEFWVDPYSEFVHNYNIGLSKDIEELGFDEIQYDYIRFPADGPVNLCYYSFKIDEDTYKSEILIDFLRQAKLLLNIPISVDIYGFNSWYFFGNWIGQDIEELSHVVDVISPMLYPSHFGNRFYNNIEVSQKPYKIVKDACIRGNYLVKKSTHIRPYLQAFNLLSPTWGPKYVQYQINASKESGCSGYILWNAKGDYSVPYTIIKKD